MALIRGGFSWPSLACEQALLFGRRKRAARERARERRSYEGPRKNDVPESKLIDNRPSWPALNFRGKCRNTMQMQMAVSSLRSWRDSCALGTFLAAERVAKPCSKAARKNPNLHKAPLPKKDAALLLILPATQARPYVRRKIVEMQKCCSHGNLISHLSSPNHNCVYII